MSACDNAIKHGVFPVPPAVIPPTTITGTRASIGWAFGAVTRRLTHTTDQTIGKTGKKMSVQRKDPYHDALTHRSTWSRTVLKLPRIRADTRLCKAALALEALSERPARQFALRPSPTPYRRLQWLITDVRQQRSSCPDASFPRPVGSRPLTHYPVPKWLHRESEQAQTSTAPERSQCVAAEILSQLHF